MTTMPVFYAEEFGLHVGEERATALQQDIDNVALLTWNVFRSLDTHADRPWLAHRLRAFGGAGVRPPVRIALWSGRDREPLLRPSQGYVAAVRAQARAAGGDHAATAELERPVEAAVRIESPDVVVLVHTMLDTYDRGAGGRDRMVELIDAGLEHARALSKTLAVAVVYPSGGKVAREVSARVLRLRDPAVLAEELSPRATSGGVPSVLLREVSWQQLLTVWGAETGYLALGGQPVRAFREHCAALGLAQR